MLWSPKLYCDLRTFHRTFVQSAYGQNKLKCAKEAVISLKLWVPETSFWELRTCFTLEVRTLKLKFILSIWKFERFFVGKNYKYFIRYLKLLILYSLSIWTINRIKEKSVIFISQFVFQCFKCLWLVNIVINLFNMNELHCITKTGVFLISSKET